MPSAIADLLAEREWTRDLVGESGAAVYRLRSRAGASDLYLKHGADSAADDVTDEMTRLLWLASRLPAPAVVHFQRSADEAWLLTQALTGRTAYQMLAAHPERRDAVVDALAAHLRLLHALPASECPYTADAQHRIVIAERRVELGLVDEDEFDPERRGWSARRVLDVAHALLPLSPDPVVTHGDYSLDNILIDADGAVAGCLDVGRLGVADRYQDLAILWNCLTEFGDDLPGRLLRKYGVGDGDERKLKFHLMLDELF